MVKVKFRHEYNEIPAEPKPIKRYWGTTCRIEEDGAEIFTSTALLSPKDQFSRIYGRSLAYWRAIYFINRMNHLNDKDKRRIRKAAVEWLEQHETKILTKEAVGL